MSEAAFDELIHAPLRLQICAMLSPVRGPQELHVINAVRAGEHPRDHAAGAITRPTEASCA